MKLREMEGAAIRVTTISPSEAPMALLLEADPSRARIEQYLPASICIAAIEEDEMVGVCVLAQTGEAVIELMNIAVAPERRRKGLGTALLNNAIAYARNNDARRLELGTGTFGYQLAFYQKAGFRAFDVLRDYFLHHYDEPIFEAGLQHKDMIRLVIEFDSI